MKVDCHGMRYAAFLGFSALSLSASTAFADSVYWNGGISNDWFTNGNWSWDSHTPTSADTAQINSTGVVLNGAAGSVNTLFVGAIGTGSLAVQNALASTTTVLGFNAGAQGTITVSGAPGSWTNSGTTTIGDSGTGVVNVTTGSQFSGGTVYLGAASGGSGTLSVSASTFSAGSFYVGFGGDGNFTLQQSSTANTGATTIANGLGATGQATIATNSNWTLSGNLTVGGGGVGTLEIKEGADVSGTTAAIGNLAASAGSSVTVSGAGTTWINSGSLIVGSFGGSTLAVGTGAVVTSAGGVIGRHSTSSVTVSGTGSIWNTGYLQVGGDRFDNTSAVAGAGTLTISAAGVVNTSTAFLGDTAGSTGTVNVTGSSSVWQVTNRVSVGGRGTGTVSITAGGVVNSAGGLVGHEAGSTGTVTISGSGSAWNNTGVFYVGNEGNGTLNITTGGKLTSTDGYVGTENGSDSSATVTGTGSQWINSGDFFVGHNNGATGEVTISAGGKITSLQGIIGDLAGSTGTVTVTGTGSLLETSGDFNVGRIGNGTLNVALGGTVNTARSLIGNNTGSVGVASVTGDGSTWTTTGVLFVGNQGNGTLTVADGGTVSAASIRIAEVAGSTGKLIVGADIGQTAGGSATLTTNAIQFGAGTGSLIFNFGGSDVSLGATISGTGSIKVANGAVIYTGDGSAFSGTTAITGGSLEVTNALAGSINVSGYGLLKGSGTIGTTTVASGGTISPGSSGVGTLNVAGNITFQSGSTYEVDVNAVANAADLIHATGTATLAGSVLHVGAASGYQDSQSYTILTADSGVSGRFTDVSSNFAFLTPSLSYDANNVTLKLTRTSTTFAAVGGNTNEKSTGAAVESLGAGNALYDAVVGLSASDAQYAFGQLAGEVYGTSTAVNLDNSRFVRTLGIDRVRQAFGDVGTTGQGASGTGPLGYAEEKSRQKTAAEMAAESILVSPAAAPSVFWAQAYGGWGQTFSSANSDSLSNVIGGIALGADTLVGDSGWRLGAMAGYARSHFEDGDGRSSGNADDYDIGLYGGNKWGPVSLRLGALYKRQSVSTARTVSFPGLTEYLAADYATDTGQVFAELGYEMAVGSARLEPFGSLAHVHVHTHGFSETGGASALTRDASDLGVTLATLGLRASTEQRINQIDMLFRSSLAWQHGFGAGSTPSRVSFAGGSDFTTYGSPLVRDSFLFELGVDMAMSDTAQVGITYNGNVSAKNISQTVKLDFATKF